MLGHPDLLGLRHLHGEGHRALPLRRPVKFDVLPDNLDGFYELEAHPGGQQAGVGRPLPGRCTTRTATAPYSADPNDNPWDTDGDGLSDQYEVESGSDPALMDTDRDGLTDYQEAQLGTNPAADSDGDGLSTARKSSTR